MPRRVKRFAKIVKPDVSRVDTVPVSQERIYLYPEEAADDGNFWMQEESYFGLAQAADTQQTKSEPWYVAPLTFAMQLYQQRQLAKIQQERMKAGLPPLTADQYRSYFQPPVATVEVAPSPQVQQWLLYGALGLAALFLIPKLARR